MPEDSSPIEHVASSDDNDARRVSRNVASNPNIYCLTGGLDQSQEKMVDDYAYLDSSDSVDDELVLALSRAKSVDPTWNIASSDDTAAQHVAGRSSESDSLMQLPSRMTRYPSEDREPGDYGYISSTNNLDSNDTDSEDQNLNTTFLPCDQSLGSNAAMLRRKVPPDPETSRRLQTLIRRHGRPFSRETTSLTMGDAVGPTTYEVHGGNDEKTHTYEAHDGGDEKAHGIYAELVRRGRPQGRDGNAAPMCSVAGSPECDAGYRQRQIDLAVDAIYHENKKTIVVDRRQGDSSQTQQDDAESSGLKCTVDVQGSPRKRLERLRKLQAKMLPLVAEQTQPRDQPETLNQGHVARKLSGARQRAIKSLRRNAAKSSLATANSSARSWSGRQRSNVHHEANAEGFVEVFMQITGVPHDKMRKMKKDADNASREHHSIASSTRSKDLVHSLPSAAKTRSVAAAKPGR